MADFDWRTLLGGIAPQIASTLVNALPGGPLIGLAVNTVGQVLGMRDPTPAKVAAAVAKGLTPQQQAALTEADMAFRVRMGELALEEAAQARQHVEALAAADNADRQSARQREVATGDQWTGRILTFFSGLVTAGCMAVLVFREVPPGNQGTFYYLAGLFSGAFLAGVNYYLGSSSGSAMKTKLLEFAGLGGGKVPPQ